MSAFTLADAGIGFILMLVMLALGLHVATTIMLLGVIGAALFLGPPIIAAIMSKAPERSSRSASAACTPTWSIGL